MASYGKTDRPASYVFQHIPVPQVFSLVKPARAFSENAFCTFGNPLSDWYTEVEGAVREGHFGETPCPPKIDSGEFQSWKDCGVKAGFFGHDHINDYVATIEGIDVVATSGIGFYSYGGGDEHGARILVLHTDKPDAYETQMVYYKDLIDRPISILQAPHIGAQYAKIVYPSVAAAVIVIIALVHLIRRRRRKKRAAR
ncbi:MAG: hypothetical protein IJH75_05715 [Mogibacterium sp.]|nr:hypothetical protein [Mogibacterium sp.]